MNKDKIKQIYDFVEQNHIRSFCCVSFDYPTSTRLIDFQDNKPLSPCLCIELDANIQSCVHDRHILLKYFTDLDIRYVQKS
jgi:hypothetical protein